MDPTPDRSRHSYPLSILFLLIAACAVVTALLSPVARVIGAGSVGVPETIGASIVGGVIMMALGVVIGAYHYRRGRGMLLGIVTGGALGVVLGPVSLSPVSQAPTIASLTVGGMLVLLVVGASFHFASREG